MGVPVAAAAAAGHLSCGCGLTLPWSLPQYIWESGPGLNHYRQVSAPFCHLSFLVCKQRGPVPPRSDVTGFVGWGSVYFQSRSSIHLSSSLPLKAVCQCCSRASNLCGKLAGLPWALPRLLALLAQRSLESVEVPMDAGTKDGD